MAVPAKTTLVRKRYFTGEDALQKAEEFVFQYEMNSLTSFVKVKAPKKIQLPEPAGGYSPEQAQQHAGGACQWGRPGHQEGGNQAGPAGGRGMQRRGGEDWAAYTTRQQWSVCRPGAEELPAALAGLRFGDQILQINGQNAAGWDTDKAHKVLKAASGERISFAVRDSNV